MTTFMEQTPLQCTCILLSLPQNASQIETFLETFQFCKKYRERAIKVWRFIGLTGSYGMVTVFRIERCNGRHIAF